MRTIIVSSTNNPDYYFYAPYIERAWNNYGWNLATCITHDLDPAKLQLQNEDSIIIRLPRIEGLREQTLSQGGRLYAANYLLHSELLMTSDIDLLPLSNYWHPDINDITVYGYDLTWYSYYPMGYIAMSGDNWAKYMNLSGRTETDFLRDAKETEIAFKPDWESWWNFDWDLITRRLKPFEKQIKFINRGQIDIAGATLARGRIDRYNWEATQNQPPPFIDAHCENNNVQSLEKKEKFIKVFEKYHGKL